MINELTAFPRRYAWNARVQACQADVLNELFREDLTLALEANCIQEHAEAKAILEAKRLQAVEAAG